MRQIGSLTNRAEAERLAAYLVTEGIAAHAEDDGDEWAIWVRDESHLETARDAFTDFRANPDDSRYQGVERTAAEIQQEEIRQREAARKNVVEMRGKWSRGGGMASPKRAPLVFVLIGASVIACLWTNFGKKAEADKFLFLSQAEPGAAAEGGIFASIAAGQVWRLLAPIFVHGDAIHLVMNMFWVWRCGAQIEHARGTQHLAIVVVVVALVSNISQALIETPYFFGMSGVACGLFGYVWIKGTYEPGARMFLSPFTIVFFFAFLFYCLFRTDIANTAHFIGLGTGAIIAYLPLLVKHGDT